MAPDTTQRDPAELPRPQTGALAPPDFMADQEGVDSLAQPPDMGSTIAKAQIAAGQTNHGTARDWAENAVAGVQAALAGFGAAGDVPAGAGALYGVGKAAEQGQQNRQRQAALKTEQAQRQQQIDLEKQRVGNEQTNQDRDYQLRLAENARQQAESVRAMSEHDKRMTQMDDEHSIHNMELMHSDVTFRQQELDREETLKSIGAKPMTIAGQETPAFDDLGQLEQYANQNKLAENAHSNGYRSRPVLGADGKYRLYEVPDSGPEWHTVKDPSGKETKIFGDPLSVLNYQEKVAQTSEANSRASLNYAEAVKQRNEIKDAGTVKAARAELSKVGGDYSKLSDGAKDALRVNAQKEFQATWNVAQAAERDMQKDPDYYSVPVDAKGNPDKNSAEYKDLAEKYHLEDAQAQLGDAYDELRQLGHGYKPPGSTGTKPSVEGPRAPAHGTAITPQAAQQFMQLAGGDPEKAKALAIAAGWGPPQVQSEQEKSAAAAQAGAAGYGEGSAKTIR